MNWEYIAGFFDGEGHICRMVRNKKSTKYQVGMAQTAAQSDVLFQIGHFLESNGVRVHFHYDNSHNKLSSKTVVRLRISDSASILNFIKGVIPFCVVKKTKAMGVMEEVARCVERINTRKTRLAEAVEMRMRGSTFAEILDRTRIKYERLKHELGSTDPYNC
jgi:hypothetical protein